MGSTLAWAAAALLLGLGALAMGHAWGRKRGKAEQLAQDAEAMAMATRVAMEKGSIPPPLGADLLDRLQDAASGLPPGSAAKERAKRRGRDSDDAGRTWPPGVRKRGG